MRFVNVWTTAGSSKRPWRKCSFLNAEILVLERKRQPRKNSPERTAH
jgi:hypothetical protein